MTTTFQRTDPRLTLENGTDFLVLLSRPLRGTVYTNGVWDVFVDSKRLDVDEPWPEDWEWAIPSQLKWSTEDPRKWVYKTAYFLVQREGWFAYAEVHTKHAHICNVGGRRLREDEPWPDGWGWVQLSKTVDPGKESEWTAPPITSMQLKRFPLPSREEALKRQEEMEAEEREAHVAADLLIRGPV